MACSHSMIKPQVRKISEVYFCPPQTLSQQSAPIGSSKQLPSTLIIKIIDTHKVADDSEVMFR